MPRVDREKEEHIEKFGAEYPSIDDKCNVCGRRYGDHFGADCPPKPPSPSSLTPRQQVALEIWKQNSIMNAQNEFAECYRLATLFLDADKEGK